MKKLILKSPLSPGDMVLLTAAVRDLHRTYPGRFVTDVRTSCPELWENNPYLTPLDETDPEVAVVECSFPLVDHANETPHHCIHGFIQFLSGYLDAPIRPTAFHGDIHLSELEKSWMSQVRELTNQDIPYWIVVAGGKYDYTIKWWKTERYQEVVDHFRGKIQFVQIGEAGHHHPKLEGVIDLRGKTSLRQLVRLVYHAQGVLCPVTFLMHLAAAVEVKGGQPPHRPCVVVAGGREPVQWEAYPFHQFIHTVGALPCCAYGGCWRSRTVPLGDHDELDAPRNLCVDVARSLPRCMDLIPAREVIRRIEIYFDGGAVRFLSPAQVRAGERAVSKTRTNTYDEILTFYQARRASERFIEKIPAYPGRYRGRGIVICGGGLKYFPSAWVCINLLRSLGCVLPIQLWFLGRREVNRHMKALLGPLHVECVDAEEVRRRHPIRILEGWPLKAYAILHCPYREVLLLDADNVAVVNPEFLFETPQFKRTGALFWPDRCRIAREHPIWRICGIPRRTAREFESGQIVVDKQRCWRPLVLTMWYNEHADFYYRHIHGDKETFHMAFRKLRQGFAMPRKAVHELESTLCQHDFQGRRIFQHRSMDKWNLFRNNKRIRGFQLGAS